uniref:Uncharacterized protein n=1 Tax=Acetobacter pasteurianus TaxID=438 RepID=I3W0B9_ACEPA|nr:hypothetical protein [Acetobacter pasteurianus]
MKGQNQVERKPHRSEAEMERNLYRNGTLLARLAVKLG